MKEKITTFIDGLIMYDYILFGSSFFLFIVFIILALVLRKKLLLSIFLVLLSFSILLIGPTYGYKMMHLYLYKNSVNITSQKQLQFVEAIVLKGSINNESEFDFKSCKITANIHRSSSNSFKNYLYKFRTIKKMSIQIENIQKSQSKGFKMIIEPFKYKKKYEIDVKAECK
jgi:hypothetical protein